MIKLGKIYENLLLEGENEEQAKKILTKYFKEKAEKEGKEEPSEGMINDLINKFKTIDTTEQNKYLPLISRFYMSPDFRSKEAGEIINAVANIEKYYNSKLQYSKDKGFFFNKEIDDLDINAGEGRNFDSLYGLASLANDYFDKIEALKKAKSADPDNETEIPKVDGEVTQKIWDEGNIEIYTGNGKQACIEHSKGTNWCIGEPQHSHYEQSRGEGASFYFVYDNSVDEEIPGSRVVIEVVKENEDEFEEGDVHIKVHDKRNEEDDMVLLDHGEEITGGETYVYDYLSDEHGVDPSIFKPIPLSDEERLENVKNKKLEDIIGKYKKMPDGAVVDLTLLYVKNNVISSGEWHIIKKHPVAKRFKWDYLWTAMTNDKIDLNDDELLEEIPTKMYDKVIKREYKYNNENTNDVLRNIPYEFFGYASPKLVNDLAKEHLEDGGRNILPASFFMGNKIDGEIIKKNINVHLSHGNVPHDLDRMLVNLSSEEQEEIIDEYLKKIDETGRTELYNDLIDIIGKTTSSEIDDESLIRKMFDYAKKNDIFSSGLMYKSKVRNAVSPQEHDKYVQKIINTKRVIVNPDVIHYAGVENIQYPIDYLKKMNVNDEVIEKMEKYGYLPKGLSVEEVKNKIKR